MKRRKFIENTSAFIACPILAKASEQWNNDLNLLSGEEYWQNVADEFLINDTRNKVLNFNSGSSGTITKTSYAQLCELIKSYNQTSFYEADIAFNEKRKTIKNEIAELLNTSQNEIALVRNTTEAINFILQGYPFNKNDEVIIADHDYPYVLNTLEKLKEQKGISIKKLSFDLNKQSNEKIINQYKKSLSNNTKLLIVSHISFHEGRILPIKDIVENAHFNNTEVLIDGAHSFAHIDFSLKNINYDYYASSLHKWLCAPHGNGVLAINQNHINKIAPINNAYPNVFNTMQKFEQLGTHAFYNQIGIYAALQFHKKIGIEKKQKRLSELSNYLGEKISKINGVQFLSNLKDKNYCAISTIRIDGDNKMFNQKLQSNYNIITKSVQLIDGPAIRISTNLFLTKKDIDVLCDTIKSLV